MFTLNSFNFLNEYLPTETKLKVTYDGESIDMLTGTKLAFWNKGSETILRDHIAKKDQITIKAVEENRVLAARIIRQTTPANNVNVTIQDDRKTVSLDFDYLDKNQGAVVFLLHTGAASEDLVITGTIKGGKRLKRADEYRYPFRRLVWFLTGIAAATLLYFMAKMKFDIIAKLYGIHYAMYVMAWLLITFVASVVIDIWLSSKRIPLPRELRSAFDEDDYSLAG